MRDPGLEKRRAKRRRPSPPAPLPKGEGKEGGRGSMLLLVRQLNCRTNVLSFLTLYAAVDRASILRWAGACRQV